MNRNIAKECKLDEMKIKNKTNENERNKPNDGVKKGTQAMDLDP
jgi:hypothetical protein